MASNASRPRRRHARRPPALMNRAVLAVLRSPLHGLLDARLCELRYESRAGRDVALPVLYAARDNRFVVLIGDAPDKWWWRHFIDPSAVAVRRGRQRRAGSGRVVTADDPAYAAAWRTYFERHHVAWESTDRLLLIDVAEEGTGAATRMVS